MGPALLKMVGLSGLFKIIRFLKKSSVSPTPNSKKKNTGPLLVSMTSPNRGQLLNHRTTFPCSWPFLSFYLAKTSNTTLISSLKNYTLSSVIVIICRESWNMALSTVPQTFHVFSGMGLDSTFIWRKCWSLKNCRGKRVTLSASVYMRKTSTPMPDPRAENNTGACSLSVSPWPRWPRWASQSVFMDKVGLARRVFLPTKRFSPVRRVPF